MVEKVNAYDVCVEHEDVQPDDVVCLDTEVQVQEDDPMQYNFVRFYFHKIYIWQLTTKALEVCGGIRAAGDG